MDRNIPTFLRIKTHSKSLADDNIRILRFTPLPFGITSSPRFLTRRYKHLLKQNPDDEQTKPFKHDDVDDQPKPNATCNVDQTKPTTIKTQNPGGVTNTTLVPTCNVQVDIIAHKDVKINDGDQLQYHEFKEAFSAPVNTQRLTSAITIIPTTPLSTPTSFHNTFVQTGKIHKSVCSQ